MKIEKLINSGIPILSGTLLGIIVLLTFLQIVLRGIFNYTFNWSDEVSQFLASWMVLFGSIWVTKYNRHLNTGLKLHQKLNERQIYLIDGILALIIAIIVAMVAYQSTIFTFLSMDGESLSLRWLKMGYVFIPLPLAMLFICYYYLKSFFKNIWLVFKKVPLSGLPGQSKG
jgi:TRAP-type C4-dicarboxylate transport system permease small subunit